MQPKPLPQRREFLTDPAIARVDQAREDLGRIIAMCPFIRGRLVSVTFAAATAKTIRHGLGVAAACFPVRMNYEAAHSGPRFTEGDQTGIDLTQSLVVTSDVACSVDLWMYPRASQPVNAGQGQSL